MRPRIPFQRIDVTAAAELVRRDDVLRLDVRDAASYARAHIAGARHLSQANLSVVITAAQFQALYHFTVGRALTDDRILTSGAYPGRQRNELQGATT